MYEMKEAHYRTEGESAIETETEGAAMDTGVDGEPSEE